LWWRRASLASTDREIEAVFASLVQARTRALLVSNDIFFNGQINQLVALAARHAIPTIYSTREFVVSGGLMSYGTSLTNAYYPVGLYRRSNSQGRHAGRTAGPAANESRVGHQYEDR
jgi:putative ABC transport system substrate-binding protein